MEPTTQRIFSNLANDVSIIVDAASLLTDIDERISKAVQLIERDSYLPRNQKLTELQKLAQLGIQLNNAKAQLMAVKIPQARPAPAAASGAPVSHGPITLESVRETFYAAIPDALGAWSQIIMDGKYLMVKADLEEEESFLYEGLSGLGLLRVFELSSRVKDGLWLKGDKAITTDNCPAELKEMFVNLLQVKAKVLQLSEKDRDILIAVCVGNPNIELKANKEITELGAKIKSVASRITQREGFKKAARELLLVCAAFVPEKQLQPN